MIVKKGISSIFAQSTRSGKSGFSRGLTLQKQSPPALPLVRRLSDSTSSKVTHSSSNLLSFSSISFSSIPPRSTQISRTRLFSTLGNKIVNQHKETQLTSWVAQKSFTPIPIVRTEGIYIHDADGKKYTDLSSQVMNVNVGHCHPHVVKAISEQAAKLGYVHPSYASEIRGQLGEMLARITPNGLNKSFFTTAGGDAVENSIKMARMVTGRNLVISRERAYHGPVGSALASGGGDPRRRPFTATLPPGHLHVEDSGCYRRSWEDNSACSGAEAASNIEKAIQLAGPTNVAAILMEGASGSSGCLRYGDDFWPEMRRVADKYDILLIADEVMSGFGRTGKWFAVDHSGTTPDIMAMAKGITGGHLPLGGVMVSDKVASHFDEIPLACGLTYSSHPTTLAAAVATIEVMENENLVERAADMGTYLGAEVDKLREKHPSIVDFRRTGFLSCIEVVLDKNTPPPLTPDYLSEEYPQVMAQISKSMAENGILTYVRWNNIFIVPPLTITRDQLDAALSAISTALKISDDVLAKNQRS